jgi:superfamily II DNA or RNA helicase
VSVLLKTLFGDRRAVQVTLPPLFRVNAKENGNLVRQLTVPPWSGEAAVEPWQKGRKHGFAITPNDGSPSVVLLSKSSRPSSNCTHAIRLVEIDFDHAKAATLDLMEATWLKHPEEAAHFTKLTDYERNAANARESWIDAFAYKEEDAERNIQGLRPPQLGAIHAVQSHWTIDMDPATVVLPTGVGKTETMIALLVAECCERLLVVVPTDVLRTQMSDKFLSLGLLKDLLFGVISQKALYPVVGTLNRRPIDRRQVDSLFRKCNVIVTTMPLASQCSQPVMRRMAELCSCLFIDEAHHVAAPKWGAFKEVFSKSRIIQFTATPFRNDDKPIGGKRVFTFSLRHAQKQGYFKEIRFKPVIEFDPARKDAAIAEAAVEQLRAEAHLGHILMARAANVARAGEVFEYYRKYTEFNPVQIHTGITSKAERDAIRSQVISGQSRIVVCVDMLGEGFDLPELKIAAFHDIRKTLAVTLQLAGRFTRTKPHLGNATFVANVADLEVKDELKRLYQHDSDWNALLPLITERVTQGEFSLWEFLGGFQELPDDITLRNVRPAMSTVVYRTQCKAWTPENFGQGIVGYKALDKVYHTLNPQENTLVVVTTQRLPVDWAHMDEIYNWDWQLYVLHWDKASRLLFIHNSSNAGFFKRLAQAVAGEVEQIKGPKVFRCLSGINRLKLQNVGLLEQLGRLIRYTMRAGSDVESGLSETQKQKAIKANLFGQGFETGHRTSIGCSYRGRIWSHRTTNLLELTRWARAVGEKLLNESLDPEEVLRGTLVPELVSKRPKSMPIAVEWPDVFHREPEQVFSFQIDGIAVYRHDADLVLVDPAESGALKFAVSSQSANAHFELVLFDKSGTADHSVKAIDAPGATVNYRGKTLPLLDFFDEHPPTFWFADGSSLTGAEYVALRRQPDPFLRDRIMDWNWQGTEIRIESQGIERNPLAIQYRVIAEMKKRPFSVLFDDDDQGESADVVGITEADDHIEVEFWHCKFAKADQPGSRITELYEVCGQAQKSIRWLEKPRDLFTHLMRREPRHYKGGKATRYEVGAHKDLLRIREKAESQRVDLKVFIVQPGLSISRVSREQLELLAVTENYLMETFAVPLGVVASA